MRLDNQQLNPAPLEHKKTTLPWGRRFTLPFSSHCTDLGPWIHPRSAG